MTDKPADPVDDFLGTITTTEPPSRRAMTTQNAPSQQGLQPSAHAMTDTQAVNQYTAQSVCCSSPYLQGNPTTTGSKFGPIAGPSRFAQVYRYSVTALAPATVHHAIEVHVFRKSGWWHSMTGTKGVFLGTDSTTSHSHSNGARDYLVVPNHLLGLGDTVCSKVGSYYKAFSNQDGRCQHHIGSANQSLPEVSTTATGNPVVVRLSVTNTGHTRAVVKATIGACSFGFESASTDQVPLSPGQKLLMLLAVRVEGNMPTTDVWCTVALESSDHGVLTSRSVLIRPKGHCLCYLHCQCMVYWAPGEARRYDRNVRPSIHFELKGASVDMNNNVPAFCLRGIHGAELDLA
ncbi:hypothetical protein MRX96_033557 [Rhipicephalus microplus]